MSVRLSDRKRDTASRPGSLSPLTLRSGPAGMLLHRRTGESWRDRKALDAMGRVNAQVMRQLQTRRLL